VFVGFFPLFGGSSLCHVAFVEQQISVEWNFLLHLAAINVEEKMPHYHLHVSKYRSWILLQFFPGKITMARHVAAKTEAGVFQ